MSDNYRHRVPPRLQRRPHRRYRWRNFGSGSGPASDRNCARCSACWWLAVFNLRPPRRWSMSRV